jgi:hypothetical protein
MTKELKVIKSHLQKLGLGKTSPAYIHMGICEEIHLMFGEIITREHQSLFIIKYVMPLERTRKCSSAMSVVRLRDMWIIFRRIKWTLH